MKSLEPKDDVPQIEKDLYSEKKEEHEHHMMRKEATRKKLAEVLASAGEDHRVIEFDLEACLTLPKSNANIVYFR
jgi:hypothetical protein